MKALWLGVGLGLLIETVRKLVKRSPRYKAFSRGSRTGRVTDFLFDAIFVASPYASSFGGFVELPTVLWWTAGGLIPPIYEYVKAKLQSANAQANNGALPEDMGTMSLVGGGLIAGDSLSALSVGIWGLIASGALKSLLGG